MRVAGPFGRALILAALALGSFSCAGYPSSPNRDDLSGSWVGSVPRFFYTDDMRLELVQSGRALAGQGVRGRPCPADGTCYVDVTVSGTVIGSAITLRFAAPFGDSFVGERAADGTLEGRLTGYDDRPAITLRRIRD
jgi:hypothetical protein